MIAKMKQAGSRHSRALMLAATLLLSHVVQAQPEDSDCIFEFNKAFELAESAAQALGDGEKFAAQSHFDSAREHYQSAIGLLQQALQQYENLPHLARDCSPTNLSIAKNNIRLANENLAWAKSAVGGLDCLQALDQIESLSNLASEYYYKHNDMTSAQQSVEDALQLIDSTGGETVCRGEYAELLLEQKKNTRQIATSLAERARYDRCVSVLEELTGAAQQASLSADPVDAWSTIDAKADAALDERICTGTFLDKLKQFRAQARDHVQRGGMPAKKR